MYYSLHQILPQIAIGFRPKNYLEIGVREGHSLKALLEVHHPLSITLCDNWLGNYGGTNKGNHNHITELLKDLKYNGEVNFLDGDSRIKIPTIKNELFKLITIDGDHSKEGAEIDLENSWNILDEGGIIIFDDIIHPAHKYLEKVAEDFIKKKGAEIIYVNNNEGHGVIVFKKSYLNK